MAGGNTHSPRTFLGNAGASGASLEMVKMILDAGADVNFRQPIFISDKYEFSILHCAVVGATHNVVKHLLDVNAKLELACKNHRLDIFQTAALYAKETNSLREIIRASNRQDFSGRFGNTLLDNISCTDEVRTTFIQELITLGHDINAVNQKGEPPLAAAADLSVFIPSSNGGRNLENIESLIETGAWISNLDDDGNNFSTYICSHTLTTKLSKIFLTCF